MARKRIFIQTTSGEVRDVTRGVVLFGASLWMAGAALSVAALPLVVVLGVPAMLRKNLRRE